MGESSAVEREEKDLGGGGGGGGGLDVKGGGRGVKKKGNLKNWARQSKTEKALAYKPGIFRAYEPQQSREGSSKKGVGKYGGGHKLRTVKAGGGKKKKR